MTGPALVLFSSCQGYCCPPANALMWLNNHFLNPLMYVFKFSKKCCEISSIVISMVRLRTMEHRGVRKSRGRKCPHWDLTFIVCCHCCLQSHLGLKGRQMLDIFSFTKGFHPFLFVRMASLSGSVCPMSQLPESPFGSVNRMAAPLVTPRRSSFQLPIQGK